MSERETFYTDIRKCARCGGDHEHVLVRKFKKEPIHVQDFLREWFAECPTLREPILVSLESGL